MTKSERTAAAILAAAEGLFLTRSYADVTMDQIAEHSQLTKGALYHHFNSKEHLYLEMMQRALEHMRETFTRALAEGAGCRERLSALTRAFFALPARQIGLMRLVRRDVNAFPPSVRGKLVRAYQGALPALVEGSVRDGIRDGELAPSDARLLAWNFVAAVEVTLSRHADSVFPDPAAKLDYVIDLFFRGAGTSRKGPGSAETDPSGRPKEEAAL